MVEREEEELRNLNATLERRVAELSAALNQASQRNLHETKASLESVVENIPIMVFIKEARELRFVRMNKAGQRLLGYSEEELLGRNDHDFFPNEESDFFINADRKTLQEN